MANEVTIPEYLKKFMDQGAGKDADAMASGSVSVPRISLKGKKFQFINGDDESKKVEEIFVSILAVEPEGSRMIKTYYASGYNPNDTAPPDCSSSDGVSPDSWVSNPVAPMCNGCPKNVFGSATNINTGKKTKACRDAKRLWVAPVDKIGDVVYGLNVPVTSLKAMADYGREVRSVGVNLAAVITRIYMDEDSEFPLIHFARAGFLNEETGLQALERSESRDWISVKVNNALPAPPKQAAIENKSVAEDLPAPNPSASDVNNVASNW